MAIRDLEDRLEMMGKFIIIAVMIAEVIVEEIAGVIGVGTGSRADVGPGQDQELEADQGMLSLYVKNTVHYAYHFLSIQN